MSERHSSLSWQHILRQNFTRWEALAEFLKLNAQQQDSILKKSDFTLNLPLRLAQKIVKGTLDDPILRQFLPTLEEKKMLWVLYKIPLEMEPAAKRQSFYTNTKDVFC